jgi:hypothetical protein
MRTIVVDIIGDEARTTSPAAGRMNAGPSIARYCGHIQRLCGGGALIRASAERSEPHARSLGSSAPPEHGVEHQLDASMLSVYTSSRHRRALTIRGSLTL